MGGVINSENERLEYRGERVQFRGYTVIGLLGRGGYA